MNRKEMVQVRVEKLQKLSDADLVQTIVRYFEKNHTMPGEKAIKDYALSLKGEFDVDAITGLLSEVRNDLIEQFASLCVKEMKVKNVQVVNDTKKNKDTDGTKVTDLPMVLKDIVPVLNPANTVKNVYELPAMIVFRDSAVYAEKDGVALNLGSIPKGFKKNHGTSQLMQGTVIVTDHSNGKFANMSYRMLVDLGQAIPA